MNTAQGLIDAARALARTVNGLSFGPPVTHVYNPLDYAWAPHRAYLRKWGNGAKQVLFLGMNPGPFGMAQVGVPFGEIAYVRDWLRIRGRVGKPAAEHPKRPVDGFACARSEVSGRRLWGCFAERFGTPESFFRDHFVGNYCPLVFIEASGKNRTPNKLPPAEREPLLAACNESLRRVVAVLRPRWVVGVGAFAAAQARAALASCDVRVGSILHPSPASPAANRGWARAAAAELTRLGVWPSRA
ncbi:MAG: single-stranded DNA-binding protein [Kiritimatiellae bacterium]|nr:single-stranded DNA-binding protein [Kiritimatiellia bacterium]